MEKNTLKTEITLEKLSRKTNFQILQKNMQQRNKMK